MMGWTRKPPSTGHVSAWRLIIKPVKTIKFKDAASRDVTIEFKAPA